LQGLTLQGASVEETRTPFKAVIFDLFGTLIPNFSTGQYRQTVLQMAVILKAPPEAFWERWTALTSEATLGILPSPEAKIERIGRDLGLQFAAAAVQQAARLRYQYEAATMLPRPEAVEVLSDLKSRGLKIGLITDCSAEAPAEWPRTTLAPWFDATVFSCLVGLKKPDPRIYHLALGKLGVTAGEVLYIGDGSSHELSGAAALGMTAVLLKAPGEQHADVYRLDLEDWPGQSVTSLREVPNLV
jgi:putative hydrolase of the HAD superfamily